MEVMNKTLGDFKNQDEYDEYLIEIETMIDKLLDNDKDVRTQAR